MDRRRWLATPYTKARKSLFSRQYKQLLGQTRAKVHYAYREGTDPNFGPGVFFKCKPYVLVTEIMASTLPLHRHATDIACVTCKTCLKALAHSVKGALHANF